MAIKVVNEGTQDGEMGGKMGIGLSGWLELAILEDQDLPVDRRPLQSLGPG